jgi:transposase
MSSREFKRGTVLARVKAGEVPLGEAARMLDVSYRQVKRLYARYKRGGAKALVHGNAHRRSNHARPLEEQQRVVALVRAHYSGEAAKGPHQRFGPTLAAEHLWEDHGVLVPVPTLRRWMRAAELWSPVRRRTRVFRRRARRAHFGELVQLDGSFHDWLEGRGPAESPMGCLMTLIDDATGTTLGRFRDQETTWGAAEVLRAWIAAYGVPRALYVDAKSLYVPLPSAIEQARGVVIPTQFGRMCAKLGIELIVAKTPQAKGRVERIHGTNQDRLIKKLRLAGITTYAAANTYLETRYLAAHNRRFAVRAQSPVDYHTRRDPHLSEQDVYCLETTRVLGRDWVVRHERRGYQVLARGAARRYCAPGSRVLLRETEDGRVRLLVRAVDGREHALDWEPVPLGPRAPRVIATPLPGTPLPATPLPATPLAADRAATPAPAGRHAPTPAQLAHRARLRAKEAAHLARRRGLQAYNAQRRAAALARAESV